MKSRVEFSRTSEIFIYETNKKNAQPRFTLNIVEEEP